MLAITIAVLGGVGLICLGSLRSANGVLLTGSENAENEAGVLITIVGSQSNSSGTYVWLFDYGWSQARLTSVYLAGGLEPGWSSTCAPLQPKAMCVVQLPPGAHGMVSLAFGTRTVGLSL